MTCYQPAGIEAPGQPCERARRARARAPRAPTTRLEIETAGGDCLNIGSRAPLALFPFHFPRALGFPPRLSTFLRFGGDSSLLQRRRGIPAADGDRTTHGGEFTRTAMASPATVTGW
jgi:hypothetical protein